MIRRVAKRRRATLLDRTLTVVDGRDFREPLRVELFCFARTLSTLRCRPTTTPEGASTIGGWLNPPSTSE